MGWTLSDGPLDGWRASALGGHHSVSSALMEVLLRLACPHDMDRSVHFNQQPSDVPAPNGDIFVAEARGAAMLALSKRARNFHQEFGKR